MIALGHGLSYHHQGNRVDKKILHSFFFFNHHLQESPHYHLQQQNLHYNLLICFTPFGGFVEKMYIASSQRHSMLHLLLQSCTVWKLTSFSVPIFISMKFSQMKYEPPIRYLVIQLPCVVN